MAERLRRAGRSAALAAPGSRPSRRCLSAIQSGISSPRRSAPCSLSSAASASAARLSHFPTSAAKRRFDHFHPAVAHGLVTRGVRLQLGAVHYDVSELHEPGRSAQAQDLHEQVYSAARWRLRKSEMVRKPVLHRIERGSLLSLLGQRSGPPASTQFSVADSPDAVTGPGRLFARLQHR